MLNNIDKNNQIRLKSKFNLGNGKVVVSMMNKGIGVKEDLKIINEIKRHGKELTERFLEVLALYSLSKGLNVTFSMDNIIEAINGLLKDTLRINDFSIMLLNEKGEKLSIYTANSETLAATKDLSFKLGEGISGLVAKTGKAILVKDVSKDKRFLYY